MLQIQLYLLYDCNKIRIALSRWIGKPRLLSFHDLVGPINNAAEFFDFDVAELYKLT